MSKFNLSLNNCDYLPLFFCGIVLRCVISACACIIDSVSWSFIGVYVYECNAVRKSKIWELKQEIYTPCLEVHH